MKIELDERELAKWEEVRARGFSDFLWRGQLISWIGAIVVAAVAAIVSIYFGYKIAIAATVAFIVAFSNGARLRLYWARMESAYRFSQAKKDADALLTRRST